MELKYLNMYYNTSAIGSSNCTFMELKYEGVWVLMMGEEVLIVPLWN